MGLSDLPRTDALAAQVRSPLTRQQKSRVGRITQVDFLVAGPISATIYPVASTTSTTNLIVVNFILLT